MRPIARAWLRTAALSWVVTWGAAAQKPEPRSYSESVDVNVVNVDVFVSRKGAGVDDLELGDFTLFENEEKVEITNFYRAAVEGRELHSLVVYVDDTHVSLADRNNVLEKLLFFLEERMAAESVEVMAVRFDGDLRVEQEFTRGYGEVRLALARLAANDPVASESKMLERNTRAQLEQTMALLRGGEQEERVGRTALDGMLSSVRIYGERVADDTRGSLEALSAISSSLGTRSGRKSLYYIGDGLVMRPLGELVATLQEQISRQGTQQHFSVGNDASSGVQMQSGRGGVPGSNPSGSSMVSGKNNDTTVLKLQQSLEPLDSSPHLYRVAAAANASRVTLYPIRPPAVDAASTGLGNRASEEERALSDAREAVDQLAVMTGGQAMLAGQNVRAFLDRTLESSSTLYSLGFRSAEASGTHALRVKAKRGLQLRYRQSYEAKTSDDLLADRTVGALALGWDDNPLGVALELESAEPGAEGNFDAKIVLSFRIGELELFERDGAFHGYCRAAFVLENSLGQRSQPQFMELPIEIPSEQIESAREQHYGAHVNLRLPPGEQKIAVGLWEEAALEGSFLRYEFTVGGE